MTKYWKGEPKEEFETCKDKGRLFYTGKPPMKYNFMFLIDHINDIDPILSELHIFNPGIFHKDNSEILSPKYAKFKLAGTKLPLNKIYFAIDHWCLIEEIETRFREKFVYDTFLKYRILRPERFTTPEQLLIIEY